MATYNGEEESSNDGDVFQEIREREIESYFKHKLLSFLSTDHTQNRLPQEEKKFDLEKELLNFLDDFQSFKNTHDNKSVTSDSIGDDDEDEDSESEDDDGEESYEDGASVVVEGSVSGLSAKDLDLIEALTDSRQKGEKRNFEKQVSLLDLDEKDLNQQLKESKADEFLINFQEELNKLQKEKMTEEKENKVKICYTCGGEIKHIGNFKKSLEAHQKEPFHILKWNEKKSFGKSECSSAVGDAALPESIFVNSNNQFCCKFCKRPIGKFRDQILSHLQSEEHRTNIQTRFDNATSKKDDTKDRKVSKDSKDDGKGRGGSKGDQKVKKEEKKNEKEQKKDKLAYAIGFACIKPANENQLLCTMCDKYIPVAKEMSTLMKNLSHHIESKSHISKMEGLQESLKTIKEKPSVQEAKKKMNDNVYKFICLPCEFDGYGYQFCKSHLKNGEHTSKIKILLDAKVPVNFTHGVKCVGCNKHIYGAKVNIDEHCIKCIKENGNNAKGRRKRNRSRPRRQKKDGDGENNQNRNSSRGRRGGRKHKNRPENNFASPMSSFGSNTPPNTFSGNSKPQAYVFNNSRPQANVSGNGSFQGIVPANGRSQTNVSGNSRPQTYVFSNSKPQGSATGSNWSQTNVPGNNRSQTNISGNSRPQTNVPRADAFFGSNRPTPTTNNFMVIDGISTVNKPAKPKKKNKTNVSFLK